MIRFVFFDIGDVLMHYKPKKFFEVLHKYSQNEDVEPRDLFKSGTLHAYETGVLCTSEFYGAITHYLKAQFLKPELFYYFFGQIIKPDYGMVRIKDAMVKTGVRMGTISNNNSFHISIIENEYPEVMANMEVKVFSHVVGMRKPSNEIFAEALKNTGVSVMECMLIDDRIENVEAFRRLGGLGYHYDTQNIDLETDDIRVTLERDRLKLFLNRIGLLK